MSQLAFDNWSTGFNLAWELDFWGRFRRAILGAEAQLDRSVEDYDAALVTLLADVATNYVQMRATEQQIKWTAENVKLQKDASDTTHDKVLAGVANITDVDDNQLLAQLRATEAQIPLLQIGPEAGRESHLYLAGHAAAGLAGTRWQQGYPDPQSRDRSGGSGAVAPAAPRRAGVRSATWPRRPNKSASPRRLCIPAISISGNLGYSAAQFGDLFSARAFNGSVGPSFQWNVLNYGRLVNNVRFQDARFRELVASYQQTVLLASEEVENGIISYLRSQQEAQFLAQSVKASKLAAGHLDDAVPGRSARRRFQTAWPLSNKTWSCVRTRWPGPAVRSRWA